MPADLASARTALEFQPLKILGEFRTRRSLKYQLYAGTTNWITTKKSRDVTKVHLSGDCSLDDVVQIAAVA
jgi:hypothetical protein